jgi:hypothetical protein
MARTQHIPIASALTAVVEKSHEKLSATKSFQRQETLPGGLEENSLPSAKLKVLQAEHLLCAFLDHRPRRLLPDVSQIQSMCCHQE